MVGRRPKRAGPTGEVNTPFPWTALTRRRSTGNLMDTSRLNVGSLSSGPSYAARKPTDYQTTIAGARCPSPVR